MSSDRQGFTDARLVITTDNTQANIDITSIIPLAEGDGTIIIATKPGNIVQLDPVLIPSTEGVLLDGSASLVAAGVYEVTFEIVNIDGTNTVTGVDIGVDIGAVGSLAAAEFILKNWAITAGGSSSSANRPLIRTITMGGNDDIRGIAAVANDAAIHFLRVQRVA